MRVWDIEQVIDDDLNVISEKKTRNGKKECVIVRFNKYTDFLSHVTKNTNDSKTLTSFLPIHARDVQKLIIKIHETFENIDLNSFSYDAFGEAYEKMMSDELGNGSKRNGQHFTKRSLIKLIIDELEIKETDICYDPSCGTGGFILEFAKRYPTTEFINNNIYGQELLEDVHKILCFNMLAHHVDGCLEHLSNGDTMDRTYNHFSKDKFDKIGANPPFGVSIDSYPDYYKIKVKDSVALFIQHIYYSLKDGGKAGIVIDRGILNNGTDKSKSWEGSLRKFLCDNCQITKIINLPTGIFKHTNFATSVIFFTKGGKTTEIKYNEGYFKLEDKGKSDKTMYLDSENEKILTIEEIREKNYSLKYDDYFKVKEEKKSGWIKLGDVCKLNQGDFITKNDNGNMYPVYGGGIKPSHYYDSYNRENKIIITRVGTGLGNDIKNTCIKFINEKFYLTDKAFSIDDIIDINEKYLFYYLFCDQNKWKKLAGGNAQPVITKTKLKEIQIPNLPLEHQTEIVEFLDEVYQDSSLEDTIKYMKDYPIFNLLINKDYDGFREILWYQKNIQFVIEEIVNVKRKKNNHIRSLFNTIKNKCKMMKLGMIVEVKRGKSLPKNNMIFGEYPVIGGGVEFSGYHNEYNYDGNNGIFISRVGTAGYVSRYLDKCYITDLVFTIEPIKKLDINICYLYYYLKYNKKNIESYRGLNSAPNIPWSSLREFEIPIPPLQIQEQIINKIVQLNEQSSHYEQYSKTLQTELELMNETISNLTLYSEEIRSDNPIETIRNNDIYDDTDKLIKSIKTKNIKIKKVECEVMDV
jgi:type I restriction-modification system DNA methylase subunit